MSRRSLGSALIALGLILAVVFALADQIGIGDGEGFGWRQLTGVIVGLLVAVAGYLTMRTATTSDNDERLPTGKA
jgi:predicted MFS family arabinose efflux permease